MCCAATASASSAAASVPTTAAGTLPARCSAPAPGPRCTAAPRSLTARGFHERYFAYLEDVDLALRLRLAGWTCRYEPAVALHAAQGSSGALPGGAAFLATRNTLVLVARFWPARWLGLVAYRQLGWAWHAARERRLRAHLRAVAAAVPMLPAALRARRALRAGAVVPIDVAVPARPWRGRGAGGRSGGRG